MEQIHPLLKRQIKRCLGEQGSPVPQEWQELLGYVNDAYHQFDDDRKLLENSLGLSSQELMQANADVRAILGAFPDLFFIVDKKKSILYSGFKESQEVYLVHKEILGKQGEGDPSGVGDLFEDSIFLVLKGRKMVKIEYWLDLQSFVSVQRCFEARILPFQDNKIFIVTRDITESKEAEKELKLIQEQLLQSDKLATIGQLAAGVAHEINNPVGFVTNNMEVLKDYIGNYTRILGEVSAIKDRVENGDLQKAKEAVDHLKKIEEEVGLEFISKDVNKLLEQSINGLERIRKIVLDLKTFAYEDKTNNRQKLKVEEILDGIVNIVKSEFKGKAELVKNYNDTPAIECDQHKLGQVFINILINAVQAINKQGKITIKTYVQDRLVCVDISDTGSGIKPENIKKIFDPFFTTKSVGQGTGLGLSVSYEIVKKHFGEILVNSKEGEGTTFTILLPSA